MAFKRAPRGYKSAEFPLPHNFKYRFTLQAEDETKNSTILTLIKATETAIDAENVEANPSHATFAEDTGPMTFMGSIVPKISFNMTATLTKGAVETDKIRNLNFKWCPIYTSFLNSLEAEDTKTAIQIEDILELQHFTTAKDVLPDFTTVNLGTGTQPVSTVGITETFASYDLSVNTSLESVAFNEETLWDAFQFFSNRGMLNKVMGQWRTVTVSRDRPYKYYNNNFTNPIVKRSNPYTYCGVLVHLPQAGSAGQLVDAGDTTAIDHILFDVQVRYDEWNRDFYQGAF